MAVAKPISKKVLLFVDYRNRKENEQKIEIDLEVCEMKKKNEKVTRMIKGVVDGQKSKMEYRSVKKYV